MHKSRLFQVVFVESALITAFFGVKIALFSSIVYKIKNEYGVNVMNLPVSA